MNELQLHNGEGRTARLVVILRITRDKWHLGQIAERVLGPWIDPSEARAELEVVRNARASECDVRLDWLAVHPADLVAAYVEEDRDRIRSTRP